jgi:hypothetical protein
MVCRPLVRRGCNQCGVGGLAVGAEVFRDLRLARVGRRGDVTAAVEDQRLVVKEDRADCFDLMAGQPNNQEQRLVLDAGGVQK